MKGKISAVAACALYVLTGGLPAAWGGDLSRLNINATTHSEEIGVHFIVTDPLGRRMGNDCTRAKEDSLRGIPGSWYTVESTGDDESGSPGPEGIQSRIGPSIAAGTYTITLCGLATAQFHLFVHSSDFFGKYHPNEQSLDSFIAAGTTAQYVLSYDPAPGKGITQFVKQVSFATLRQDLRTAAGLSLIGDAKFVAKLDKILAEGEKALSKKGGKEKDRENQKEAVEKLRQFIRKLEKSFKGGKDDDRDEDDDRDHEEREKPPKRYVSETAYKALKSDAQTLIAALGGKPGKGQDDD